MSLTYPEVFLSQLFNPLLILAAHYIFHTITSTLNSSAVPPFCPPVVLSEFPAFAGHLTVHLPAHLLFTSSSVLVYIPALKLAASLRQNGLFDLDLFAGSARLPFD